MIHWGWLIMALFVGSVGGIVLVSLLAAGANESAYRLGFYEGHAEGLQKGLTAFQKVG